MVYTAILIPGEYIINATMTGFMKLSEYFVVTKGACENKFAMEKKVETGLSITAVDINKGTPINGALLKLSTQTKSMNVENLTDKEGKTQYITDGNGYYTLTVSREGYIPYTKEMCISKTSLNNITIPLLPLGNDLDSTVIEVFLSGDACANGMNFTIYCPISK